MTISIQCSCINSLYGFSNKKRRYTAKKNGLLFLFIYKILSNEYFMQQIPIKDQCQVNVKFDIVILYTSMVSMTLQIENVHNRENAF